MAKIFIDGKSYEVDGSQNLLHACLSLKLDLPYFCWHPAMGSVGACRQCAVKKFKDENDTRGRLVMACMEPASDGTRISIQDPEAREMRANVIEWLMTNHPHDCPVCDEGGECHLQDMTVMTGHNYRRFCFPKRTYRNQYLGPFIHHEMNRCIQCYRCVRFYRDYAGGRDLDVFSAHNHVYFGRHEDGVLENEFSGNLVEVCPTGVFTDKTLKQHYARKWDLQSAPSICVHCGLGCNIIGGERYGKLVRILSRYNGQVNGYFICDRGRFGYEFVNDDQRIRTPLYREEDSAAPVPLSAAAAREKAHAILQAARQVIGIGSARAALESNYALRKLVGADHFFAGMSATQHRLTGLMVQILQNGPMRTPSLRETEQADAVLVLGEDVTQSAPMLALALRQAARRRPLEQAKKRGIAEWHDAAVRELVQDDKGPVFIATPAPTKLDDIATRTLRAAPDDLARLGFAIAHALDESAPAVPDLSPETATLARQIAAALKTAEKPLIVCGTSCSSEALIKAAANVARALCRPEQPADLCFTVPDPNAIGLALLAAPPLENALEKLRSGAADTVIILENDLSRLAPAATVQEVLRKARQIIVIDHRHHFTTEMAHLVLPAGTFAESDGTLINNEGRAQRFYQIMSPQEAIMESWRWLEAVRDPALQMETFSFHELVREMADSLPQFAGIDTIAPPPDFRVAGQKIPRQPHRYSGRTAMHAHINVSEPKPPEDPDSPLAFSMEGFHGEPPPALIPRFWSPGWNSVQAINKFQSEVGGPLHGGDPGRRLLEPSDKDSFSYFNGIPDPFRPRKGEWLLLPAHHIFGSEPLSAAAPAIAERAPLPYLALAPEEAEELQIAAGEKVKVALHGQTALLPLQPMAGLPRGVALLPLGRTELDEAMLPAFCKLQKAKEVPG